MKSRLLSFFLLLLLVSAAPGQSESQRILEPVAPYLNENTLLLAHLDLEKIDLDRIDEELRPLMLDPEGIFVKQYAQGSDFAELAENLDQYKAVAKAFLVLAKTTYKVRDVYFLVNPTTFPRCSGYFVIPMKDPKQAETLLEAIKTDSGRAKVHGNNLLIFCPGSDFLFREDVEKLFTMLQIQTPSERPELISALDAVGDSALQIVFFPSAQMQRVVLESVDVLPDPLGKTPITVFTRGVHWAVLAADSNRVRIDLIVQSEQSQAAKDFRGVLEILLDEFLKYAEQFRTYKNFLEAYRIERSEMSSLARELLPEVKGDQLVLTIDKTNLLEKGNRVLELSAVSADVVLSSTRTVRCKENLKQLLLGLHNYHDANGQFPSACSFDAAGKPLHGWRVALLPYIEQYALYKQIRLEEPWDSEYNKQFHEKCPAIFQCPQVLARNPEVGKKGLTTYSVIVGKNAFPEDNRRFTMSMITDGTSNTIGVVERKTPVCWMDPTQEITQENAMPGAEKSDRGIGAPHDFGKFRTFNTALFDGSAHTIQENILPEVLRALITRNGGETPAPSRNYYPHTNEAGK